MVDPVKLSGIPFIETSIPANIPLIIAPNMQGIMTSNNPNKGIDKSAMGLKAAIPIPIPRNIFIPWTISEESNLSQQKIVRREDRNTARISPEIK